MKAFIKEKYTNKLSRILSWLAYQAGPDKAATPGTNITREVNENLTRLLSAFEVLDRDRLWFDHHIRLKRGYLKMEDLRTIAIPGPIIPLVILNMCESAQVFPSLSDGLVNVFLRRGALGVIGTEVSMPPKFADLLGRQLIEGLALGAPVGEILWRLRREFMDARNPLGFAYSHYGDASVRITPPVRKLS